MYLTFFFFFKQKTAYEMRISDWSSDVCSSDLRRDLADIAQRLQEAGTGRMAHRHADSPAVAGQALPQIAADESGAAEDRHDAARKSVGWGKSVSVRVDLGGRRSIKKKTTQRRKIESHTTKQ